MIENDFILTWGVHPEDVAIEKVELGAAILFNENDFSKKIDDGEQHLLISKPVKLIEFWITSANAKEPEINNLEKFKQFVSTKLSKR